MILQELEWKQKIKPLEDLYNRIFGTDDQRG